MMKVTRDDIGRTFTVSNTGDDDWICRVIDWEGELYIRHEVGKFKGCVTPAKSFNFNNYCTWTSDVVSNLTRAVQIVREAKGLNLQFEDLTDWYWQRQGDSIIYSPLASGVESETGDTYSCYVMYEQDSDEKYIRYYVDNECGDKYDVVLSKDKMLEE